MAKKKKIRRIIKRTKEDNVEILKEISKDFGTLGFLADEEQLFILPTIFPSFNRASHIGGLPGGSIVELHGPNQGGKTALGIALLISAQRAGHIVGILDHEGSFKDKKWPIACGLDLSKVIYAAPDSFEEGAERINTHIHNFREKQRREETKKEPYNKYKNIMMLWLCDSLTAMTPEDLLLGKIGKANFGLHARLTSDWLSSLNTLLKTTINSVIIINQERANIGAKAFERKWRTAGGEALKFYAHFRVRVLQSSRVKSGEEIIGKQHRFIVEKNKVSAPDEMGYFFTSNGKVTSLGFDMEQTYFREAVTQDIIEKEGKQSYICNYDDETEGGLTQKKFVALIKSDVKFKRWLEKQFQRRIERGLE